MLNTYSFYLLKSTKLFISLGLCCVLCQVACQVACQESLQASKQGLKQSSDTIASIGQTSSQDISQSTVPSKEWDQNFSYHQSPVSALSQTEDYYIFGHSNGAISIWNSALNEYSQAIMNYLAHEQSIRMIEQITKKSFRSLSSDGSWAEWDLQGRVIKRGRLKENSPNVMLSSADGPTKGFSFFGDAKGTVTAMHQAQRIWRTAGEHGRAVFGLALYDQQRLMSVGSDGWARCWFNQNGETCGALSMHKGWATYLSKFQDHWLTGGSDGYIKIWPSKIFESYRGQPAQTAKANTQSQAYAQLQVHPKNITHITHQSDLILSGDDLGHVCLSRWDADDRFLKKVWQIEQPHLAPIKALMIDLSKQRILVGGGTKAQVQSYPLYGINGLQQSKSEASKDKEPKDNELNAKAKFIIQF